MRTSGWSERDRAQESRKVEGAPRTNRLARLVVKPKMWGRGGASAPTREGKMTSNIKRRFSPKGSKRRFVLCGPDGTYYMSLNKHA